MKLLQALIDNQRYHQIELLSLVMKKKILFNLFDVLHLNHLKNNQVTEKLNELSSFDKINQRIMWLKERLILMMRIFQRNSLSTKRRFPFQNNMSRVRKESLTVYLEQKDHKIEHQILKVLILLVLHEEWFQCLVLLNLTSQCTRITWVWYKIKKDMLISISTWNTSQTNK